MKTFSVTKAAGISLAAVALLAGSARRATAQSVTLGAVDSGWYDSTGFHDSTNPNYLVGRSSAGAVSNNFFVFDVSGLAGAIASAELRIFNPAEGFASPDASETYSVSDVLTPIPTLLAGGIELTSLFADLGSGVSYGAQTVSAADNERFVTISLNAAALSALNSTNGLFAFGGTVSTLGAGLPERVFGFSGVGVPGPRLVVTLVSEPGALTLLGAGALVLVGCGRRRKAGHRVNDAKVARAGRDDAGPGLLFGSFARRGPAPGSR